MKRNGWILHLFVFLLFVAASLRGIQTGAAFFEEQISKHKLKSSEADLRVSELKKEEEKLTALSSRGEELKRYRLEWEARIRTYNTHDAMKQVVAATLAHCSLAVVGDADTNRIIENNSRDYRILTHCSGKPAQVLTWIAAMQEAVDPLVFEEIRISSLTEDAVDVRTEAVVHLR